MPDNAGNSITRFAVNDLRSNFQAQFKVSAIGNAVVIFFMPMISSKLKSGGLVQKSAFSVFLQFDFREGLINHRGECRSAYPK